MQVQRQEDPLYETLKSSSELGWSTVLAELRSYHCGEGTPPTAPRAQIEIVLGGSDTGIAGYRIGKNWRYARPTPGLIWLKPTGGQYDAAYVTPRAVQVLNLYLDPGGR